MLHSPVYDILAYLLISTGFLGVAFLCCRLPFYRQHLATRAISHYPALDGLRGFLALGVFFYHSIIAYHHQLTGNWDVPPSAFYALLGQAAVCVFFMLTGFLFWRKALVGHRFTPRLFYTERFRRLAPAYLLSLLLICLAIALPIGTESVFDLTLKDVRKALFFRGLPSTGTRFAVYWTLPWEWKYYLLLPLLAFAANRRIAWLIALAVLLYTVFKPKEIFLINFVVGAAVAELTHRYPTMLRALKLYADPIAAATLLVLFASFQGGYGYAQSALLGLFFCCMVAGGTFWGLLTTRPALLLGTISYSIYLLHCIVIYLCVETLNQFTPVSALSLPQYFSWMPLQGIGVILLALLSYRYAEHPWMTPRTKRRA